MENPNKIQAGLWHTSSHLAGLSLDEALNVCRVSPLDVLEAHRPTVLRLLRRYWRESAARAAAYKEAAHRRAAYDAAVAAAYPKEWERAAVKNGAARRETRRMLRRRFAAEQVKGE